MTKKKNPLVEWLAGADTKKLAAQLVAIVVTVWTLLGVQASVDALSSDVTTLKREVRVLSNVKQQLRKVSEAQDDILEVIERATRIRPRPR